jgi:hypothetical protein
MAMTQTAAYVSAARVSTADQPKTGGRWRQKKISTRPKKRVVPCFPGARLTRERRLWQAQAIGVVEAAFRDPIIDAGLATAVDVDNVLLAVRAEFEAGQHANSDLLYVAYGQRLQ